MFDAVLFELGARRVLWGTGAAMETGLAQLRALAVIGPGDEAVEAVRWGNAARIFRFARRAGPMSLIDVNTFVGGHPHRHVPHPEAGDPRARARARAGGRRVGGRTSRRPSPTTVAADNDALFEELAPHGDVLSPAPVVRPDRPRVGARNSRAAPRSARPPSAPIPSTGGCCPAIARSSRSATRARAARLPLVLTVQLEDPARRDWPGAPDDLGAAAIAKLVRGSRRGARRRHRRRRSARRGGDARLLSPGERARLWWDISWIAGPPRDDLARLFATLGAEPLPLWQPVAAAADADAAREPGSLAGAAARGDARDGGGPRRGDTRYARPLAPHAARGQFSARSIGL